MPRLSRPIPATAALSLMLLLSSGGCSGEASRLDVRQSEALVQAEAPAAIAIAAGALSATKVEAAAQWSSCGGYPVSRYGGWALLTVPPGDRNAQREAVRAALARAGYEDVAVRDDWVVFRRGQLAFSLRPRLTGTQAGKQWTADFHVDQCARHDRRERARIEDGQHKPRPLAIPHPAPAP